MTSVKGVETEHDLDRYLGLLPATPSGKKTTSTLIYTGPCLLCGVKIITNGTNNATVKVYDNTEASGTQTDEWIVNGSEYYGGTQYGKSPLKHSTGLYITISGTGAYFFASYFTPAHTRTFGRADGV